MPGPAAPTCKRVGAANLMNASACSQFALLMSSENATDSTVVLWERRMNPLGRPVSLSIADMASYSWATETQWGGYLKRAWHKKEKVEMIQADGVHMVMTKASSTSSSESCISKIRRVTIDTTNVVGWC